MLAEEVHIGNFVEVKNSQVAANSKANHLAYIGDATIGSRAEALGGKILELCVKVGGSITGEHGVGREKINQMCGRTDFRQPGRWLAG